MIKKYGKKNLLKFLLIFTAGIFTLACSLTGSVLTPPPPAAGGQPGGPQVDRSATPTRTPTRPFQPPATRRPTGTATIQPTINFPTPSATQAPQPLANGALLLEDDFHAKFMKPLYEEKFMTLTFSNNAVRMSGLKAGVLPVLYQSALPPDILAEVDIRAEAVAVGTHYGFILRSSASIIELPQYVLGVFYFNARKIGVYSWQDGKWITSKIENLPPTVVLKPGDYNRVRLETLGGQFRFFINQVFAGSFNDETVRDGGYFGLYVSTDTSRPFGVDECGFF